MPRDSRKFYNHPKDVCTSRDVQFSRHISLLRVTSRQMSPTITPSMIQAYATTHVMTSPGVSRAKRLRRALAGSAGPTGWRQGGRSADHLRGKRRGGGRSRHGNVVHVGQSVRLRCYGQVHRAMPSALRRRGEFRSSNLLNVLENAFNGVMQLMHCGLERVYPVHYTCNIFTVPAVVVQAAIVSSGTAVSNLTATSIPTRE